jgi:hypothetical protein
VRGWPGVGKTTLAAMLAHDRRTHAAFPDGVFWIEVGQIAAERQAADQALLERLCKLGGFLGDDLDKARDLDAAASQLRGLLDQQGRRSVLLILDDVWQATHFHPFQIVISGGAILVTTRVTEAANEIAGAPENVYALPVLALEAALELLHGIAPAVVDANRSACKELVQAVECLPLALTVAGGLLRDEPGCGVRQLLSELAEGRRLLEARAPSERTALEHEAPTLTVAALLRRSVEVLEYRLRWSFARLGAVRDDRVASFSLEYLGWMWRPPESQALDSARTMDVAEALFRRGLLERIDAAPPAPPRYQMHALLVLLARSLCSSRPR